MRKYNRQKTHNTSSRRDESDSNYEYHMYSLWYDFWYEDSWEDREEIYDLEEGGMNWFYDNLEVIERNRNLNEVLGIDDEDIPSFVFLNYREPLYYNGEWW